MSSNDDRSAFRFWSVFSIKGPSAGDVISSSMPVSSWSCPSLSPSARWSFSSPVIRMLSFVPAYFFRSNAADPSDAGSAVAPAPPLADGAAVVQAASTVPMDAADMPSRVARLMNCRRVHRPLMTPSIACATCPSVVGALSSLTAILLVSLQLRTCAISQRECGGCPRECQQSFVLASPCHVAGLLEADDQLAPLVVAEDFAGDDRHGVVLPVLDRHDLRDGGQRVTRRNGRGQSDGRPARVQQRGRVLGPARIGLREAGHDGRGERAEDDHVTERTAAGPVGVAVHRAGVAGGPGKPQLLVAPERPPPDVLDPGPRHGISSPPARPLRVRPHPGRPERMPSGSSWTWLLTQAGSTR